MRFLKHARARLASIPQPINTPSQSLSKATGTIGQLSDNMLLKIFCYFLNTSPQSWPRLVHICRKWRRIVFASQRALHLRLFCVRGTPVQYTLDCWPATLPVVVEYGGSPGLYPPAPEDENEIMAALNRSDRVTSISLTITSLSSLLERLSTIETPFSELEDLVLLSRDRVRWLTLPSAFRRGPWGTRLRSLHLTRIAFFALPELLYSSINLVDLQLHEFLYPWHLPTDALTNALSGMSQLRSLSLHFLSAPYHSDVFLPSRKRVILPSLTRFDFRGITKYLEELGAGIDAPRLGDIEVTFFNEAIFELSKISEFINRIGLHKSHCRADIISSEYAISISLIQPGAPTCLKFRLLCEELAVQLSSMAQICIHLTAFLFDVEDLRITATRQSRREDCLQNGPWLEPRNPFAGVKYLHVGGNLSMDILRALQLPDTWRETMLPALHKLYIRQPGPRHAPFREAVASFMTSCRASGQHIAMEYGRLHHKSELHGEGPFYLQVTIEILHDDILLNIFRHCLDATPQLWPTLGSVCQRWRHIVLTSPLGLNLRLYFTYGTPVLKALARWLVLPITVQYGGFPNLDPPASEDDDNIIAALKESGRVTSLTLTLTCTLHEKLSAISEPLSELEELTLLSRNDIQRTLPSTFRWGPRLRTLHLTRIAFPSIPPLLLPCHDLVDLQLHEIPSAGYFSPEAFANALPGMPHLRSLSLHFLSFPHRRSFLALPPSAEERVVLPVLTRLKYRGTSKYLDSLVARIDAPRLGDIEITFFSQPTMDALQLGRFMERTAMQTLLFQADIETSAHAISISFTSSSTSTPLRLQISCKQLDWQLSCMAQVCHQFSSFLLRVEDLGINTTKSSSGQGDMAGEQWLEVVRSFDGARDFRVADKLTNDILRSLPPTDGDRTTVLPALRYLCVENPMTVNEPSWDAFVLFIISRSLSGRPVKANVPLSQCHICHANFRHQIGLELHLIHEHAFRIVCSYCEYSVSILGKDHIFWSHLAMKHRRVARKDALLSSPLLAYPNTSELEILRRRHSVLLAPEIVASSTTTMTRHCSTTSDSDTDEIRAWLDDTRRLDFASFPWTGRLRPGLKVQTPSKYDGFFL